MLNSLEVSRLETGHYPGCYRGALLYRVCTRACCILHFCRYPEPRRRVRSSTQARHSRPAQLPVCT